MSTRSIQRNILKQKEGTNKINHKWRMAQVYRYGFDNWLHNYFIPCNGKTSTINHEFGNAFKELMKNM